MSVVSPDSISQPTSQDLDISKKKQDGESTLDDRNCVSDSPGTDTSMRIQLSKMDGKYTFWMLHGCL